VLFVCWFAQPQCHFHNQAYERSNVHTSKRVTHTHTVVISKKEAHYPISNVSTMLQNTTYGDSCWIRIVVPDFGILVNYSYWHSSNAYYQNPMRLYDFHTEVPTNISPWNFRDFHNWRAHYLNHVKFLWHKNCRMLEIQHEFCTETPIVPRHFSTFRLLIKHLGLAYVKVVGRVAQTV
jgi:hypothetical protein